MLSVRSAVVFKEGIDCFTVLRVFRKCFVIVLQKGRVEIIFEDCDLYALKGAVC